MERYDWYATSDPETVQSIQAKLDVHETGQLVEECRVACATTAFSAATRRYVVAGGETSGAVTGALDTKRLKSGKEIAVGGRRHLRTFNPN